MEAKNPALLAVHILAMRYPHLADRLKEYRRSMAERVHQQDNKLQEEIL